MSFEVRVSGLRELNRAFARMSSDLKRELRDELIKVAEPVRADATQLAQSRIRNIGDVWDQMRVGVTQSAVYVAPKARRRRGSPRPNLAQLLLADALIPAAQEKEPDVVAGLESMLSHLIATSDL